MMYDAQEEQSTQRPVPELFGSLVFNDDAMRSRVPKEIYQAFCKAKEEGLPLDETVAGSIANAMKGWADYPEHNIMAYFKEADRERLCPIIESIQEADRNREGRKSGFYFVDDPDMVRVTDGCIVEVEGIEGGTQLFAAYVSQLQLFSISASLRRDDPDLDWDDFYDVLIDTNLMEERDIVILHRGIPHFPEEDSLSFYLQLLQEIVEEWNTKMMHSVMIYFSHEDEQTVLGILSQLREEENKSIKEYLQRKASGLIK